MTIEVCWVVNGVFNSTGLLSALGRRGYNSDHLCVHTLESNGYGDGFRESKTADG